MTISIIVMNDVAVDIIIIFCTHVSKVFIIVWPF